VEAKNKGETMSAPEIDYDIYKEGGYSESDFDRLRLYDDNNEEIPFDED